MPFPERVRSVAVTGGEGGVVVLGTEGGRLIVWEVSGNINWLWLGKFADRLCYRYLQAEWSQRLRRIYTRLRLWL